MITRGNRSPGRLLPAFAFVAAGLLLTGCGGDGAATSTDTTSPSPAGSTSPAVEVTDASVGKALTRIVYSGRTPNVDDGGACFVKALEATKFSPEATTYLVELDTDDWGAATQGLRKDVAGSDADIFGGQALRSAFDSCVDKALAGKTPQGATSTRATDKPATATRPSDKPKPSTSTSPTPSTTKAPNLKPKYEIAKGEEIRSASQLEKGLVSMFTSFVVDEKQRRTYQKAGPCLADAVFDAGFSQKSLLFLAGGAPLGSGEVVDHLATKEDKVLWESREFKAAMVECTLATPTEKPSESSSPDN